MECMNHNQLTLGARSDVRDALNTTTKEAQHGKGLNRQTIVATDVDRQIGASGGPELVEPMFQENNEQATCRLAQNLTLCTAVTTEVMQDRPMPYSARSSGTHYCQKISKRKYERQKEWIEVLNRASYKLTMGNGYFYQNVLKITEIIHPLGLAKDPMCSRGLSCLVAKKLKQRNVKSVEILMIDIPRADNPAFPRFVVIVSREGIEKISQPSERPFFAEETDEDYMATSDYDTADKSDVGKPVNFSFEAVICDPLARSVYPARESKDFMRHIVPPADMDSLTWSHVYTAPEETWSGWFSSTKKMVSKYVGYGNQNSSDKVK